MSAFDSDSDTASATATTGGDAVDVSSQAASRSAAAGSARVATSEALPAGHRLGPYEIQRVIGSGGFGIVYLAIDRSLERAVAIKEYLPATHATRAADGGLALRSTQCEATFDAGLRSFVNEARLLARFDHPSLVKVHHFWEAGGTAYMVMPWYQGATLRQVRLATSGVPDPQWARRILDDLLGALEVVHAASVVHRDVAPDNVVLLPDGRPVLLDFGSARRVLVGDTRTITAVVKPAYAPIEQYAGEHEFRHGPWTDIYAAAATLHWCLLGEAPPTAAARAVHDHYRPLAARPELRAPDDAGTPYDVRWLAALDWALQVKPQARPQSVAEWREALGRCSPSRRRRAPKMTPPPVEPRAARSPAQTPVAAEAGRAAPADAYAATLQLPPPRREFAAPAWFAAAAAGVGIALVVLQAPSPRLTLPAPRPAPHTTAPAPPLQAATPSPLSAVDADALIEDAVLPPPSLPPMPMPAAVPLDGVMAPPAAMPTLAAAPSRGGGQRIAGIAPRGAQGAAHPAVVAARSPVDVVRDADAAAPTDIAFAPPRDPPRLPARAPDTPPAPQQLEQPSSPGRAAVAVARATDVAREPRAAPAGARAAPGSVVQVSPAAPNRAAVYVAHPVPVAAWPPRPPRTLVTYAE